MKEKNETKMSALASTLDELRSKLYVDTPKPLQDVFKLVEEKSKVNIEYIVLGFLVLLALLVFAGVGAGFISNVVGFVYPAYATLVILEQPKPDHSTTAWLTYWVFFAALGFVERIFAVLVSRIPLFYPIKITALLWCMLPQYKGAEWIQKNLLSQLKLSSPVDAALNCADPKAAVEKAKDN